MVLGVIAAKSSTREFLISNPREHWGDRISWKKHAEELWSRYGVEVLPVSEETIKAALPEFLNKFADDIEKASQGDLAKRFEAAS